MLKFPLILGTAACALALWGCGQKGALVLPTEPAAQSRATLPQSVKPILGASAIRIAP